MEQDIKIRVLPRKGETLKKSPLEQPSRPAPRWIVYVGTVCLALLGLAFLLPNKVAKPAMQKTELSSEGPIDDSVSRHLRESLIREQVMKSHREMENQNTPFPNLGNEGDLMANDAGRNWGVTLDSEDTAEQLYRQLNDNGHDSTWEGSPDERISARLAKRKWVNEMERADRILFVRNFIRAAYDRGFQVELDQNLTVVGVKRITGERKVDINQVIDQLASKGY